MIYKLIVYYQIPATMSYFSTLVFIALDSIGNPINVFQLGYMTIFGNLFVFLLVTGLGFLMKIYNFRDKKSTIISSLLILLCGIVYFIFAFWSCNRFATV